MESVNKKILDEIIMSVQQIKYGEVVITVHDSEVTQIEKKEKKRFDLNEPLRKQS